MNDRQDQGHSNGHGDEKVTVPEPQPSALAPALERNIEAIRQRREQEEAEATAQERVASFIANFVGSMLFVYLHLVIFGIWIVANLGWLPGIEPWDPTFVGLAMVASVEAIFLSTFILINQNRMARADQRREQLDLQISLLAEHEITKAITLLEALSRRLDVRTEVDKEISELKQDVAPEAVLDRLDEEEKPR